MIIHVDRFSGLCAMIFLGFFATMSTAIAIPPPGVNGTKHPKGCLSNCCYDGLSKNGSSITGHWRDRPPGYFDGPCPKMNRDQSGQSGPRLVPSAVDSRANDAKDSQILNPANPSTK